MKSFSVSVCAVCFLTVLTPECVTASVFMPYTTTSSMMTTGSSSRVASTLSAGQTLAARDLRLALHRQKSSSSFRHKNAAMAIPGYGLAEQVFVGGFGNFLSIFNLVITARILLSWFPQAQSVGLLQPVYAITDPYLNLFRGLIPPLFGLDLSPLLAFFLLSVLQNATAAVGAEIPPNMKNLPVFSASSSGSTAFATKRRSNNPLAALRKH